MALVKHNNNSISSITTPGQIAQGKMTLISEQTASSSASISFTNGIDSTYPIYRFEFINIHPSNNGTAFQFNMSVDGGSNYNVVKTTTYFLPYHNEAGNSSGLIYSASSDLAQSTAFQGIILNIGNDNDQSGSGELTLFNPSSTTFVKHFMAKNTYYHSDDFTETDFLAGYGNTVSAVNAIRFQMSSGNIDDGKIKLYGIKDS